MITILALTAAAYTFPLEKVTPEFCFGVDKEVVRVETELSEAEGHLQKIWLNKQLKALNAKLTMCLEKSLLTAPENQGQTSKKTLAPPYPIASCY